MASVLSKIAGVALDHFLGISPEGFSRPPKGKRRLYETVDQPSVRCSWEIPEGTGRRLELLGQASGNRGHFGRGACM
jgi:hypothetical protein